MDLIYKYIIKQEDVPNIVEEAKKQQFIPLDTETTGLDYLDDNVKLLLVQLLVGDVAYVIDARKVDLSPLKEVLEDRAYTKIIQNANFDYKMLYVKAGISVKGIYDTQIAEKLLHAGMYNVRTNLLQLVKKYCDVTLDKQVRQTFVDFDHENGVFTDEQLEYSALDVWYLIDIMKNQQRYIKEFKMTAISNLEFRLIEPIAHMEIAGIKLDAVKWRKTLVQINERVFNLSRFLRDELPAPLPPPPKPVRIKKDGTPYKNNAVPKPPPVLNLDSWQQVNEAFDAVGIDLNRANKVTRKGLTNNATLLYAISMCDDDKKKQIIKSLVDYREVKQVEKTFGESLLGHIAKDGRIHARFHQTGTDSGRLSSSDPNLQNIKKKGKDGKILRACFVPEKGCKFIVADYSQIELRLAAELSGDPLMLAALAKGEDLHWSTARDMYDTEDVDDDLRRAAKTLNFGIIYGMEVKTLSERIGCSLSVAAEHLERYKNTYSVLIEYLTNAGNKALEKGLTRTVGGRCRWFPDLSKRDIDFKERRRLENYYIRVGKNHPIQGTSADMTKTAIILMFYPLQKIGGRLVNTIHDEVCVEVPEENAIIAARIVNDTMIEGARKFLKQVPILVDLEIKDAWGGENHPEDNTDRQQLYLIPK